MQHARLSAIAICIFLSSCSSVKIYDDPWCADAGKYGAECFNTLTDKEFSLNKYEWDKLRVGQICTATKRPGEGYKHVKVPLEKFCADSNMCAKAQEDQLKSVTQKADNAIDSAGGSDPFAGSEKKKGK